MVIVDGDLEDPELHPFTKLIEKETGKEPQICLHRGRIRRFRYLSQE